MKNVSKWSQSITKIAGLALLGVCGFSSQVAGNQVRVALEGELLVISGDNAANHITISTDAVGNVSVIGRNGTRVNGRPSVLFQLPTINAAEIKMNGGNDNVVLDNMQIRNDLYADLGAGHDSLLSGSQPSSIGANATVEGGMGNDTIRSNGWLVGGNYFIDGQVGRLTAELTGVTVDFELTVIGDEANDLVTCTNCASGAFSSIETKGGADLITITEHLAFALQISTDRGNDTVALDGVSTIEDVSVNTGTENDIVTFMGVQTEKNINVSLDAGIDSFLGMDVFAAFDAVFNGGAGSDTFRDLGVLGGIKTEIVEFEILP